MKKVLLTGLGPISNKIHSHKAAQAIIYADQLEVAGYDVTINLVNDKIYDYNPYDEVYIYHGSDWSGNLNLFGGIQAYPFQKMIAETDKAVWDEGMQVITLEGEAADKYLDGAFESAWNRMKDAGSEHYDALRKGYYDR